MNASAVTPETARTVDTAPEARLARQRYLREHAGRLYAELTADRTVYLRLDELLRRAGEQYPGLVPGADRMAAERGLRQVDKEGLEIDQGIFLQAVLAHPESGRHLIDAMLRPTERALGLLAEYGATGRADLGAARIERRDGTAHVTIHNEHCLNAETNAHVEALETAVDLVLLDEASKVGVLRGAPMTHPRYLGRRVFSAGINLTELHEGTIGYADFLMRRELGYISKIYRGVLLDEDQAWPQRTREKPWVAAVDTFAIGGGAQLLLVFDHVIAAADAFFSLPAAQEGIVPGLGNLRLDRFGGSRAARQVILSGRKIWASEPAGAALFDEVVDPRAVDAAVEAAATRLAGPAVVPNRHMLHHSEEPVEVFRHYLAEFALQQALRLYGLDVIAKVGQSWTRNRRTAEAG
ncbi:(3,5-dihydroxyphenyl)acetyl-CoA 1,2-dioxygenase DpgC [Kitasatospora camelliae]|uniref:(3,5-dihydroxyphenyl)acetyl-CoA 1,2-dioxygenase DpgC n=1 Tax=Kitasatospora camelliae TaxID=3156397 RepID=A0AAU8JW15_9ACTN